ncbi:MAG: FRG domain-containing protein [Thermoflexales bacterium]|nr:FRG domain-containing protein [Thermoflexales bacterium]
MSDIPTLTLRGLSELTGAVDDLTRTTGLRWWFRGHTNAGWDLLPGARRMFSKSEERHVANEFYVRARSRHPDCPAHDDYGGWLALMQHFGLPTRLLDWTYSPMVAAFFATERYHPHSDPPAVAHDACIWALSPTELNAAQGFEPLLYPLNAYMLQGLVRPALKGEDGTDAVVAATPVETDLRMLVQQGAFTAHASTVALNGMPDCNRWLRKFVIPAEHLPAFARELALLGLRLGDLFPDLDNLARELRGWRRRR